MGEGNRRWIIRDASGRISGPYTTEKILYKIGRGEFSGEESISHYPGGRWIGISTDPQFYDKLLEVLANKGDAPSEETTRILEFTKPEPETKLEEDAARGAQTTTSSGGEETDSGVPETESFETPDDFQVLKKKSRSKSKRKKLIDIELVDMRPEIRKALLKRIRIPAILMALGGLAVAAVIFLASPPPEERIHLVAPQKNIPQVAPESLKGRVRQGVSEFLRDTFSGYIRAQNEFVYVSERDNKNAEVMALLCLTYLQLWPYAHQDSGDTKTIGNVVQMSTMADPAGVHAAACRVVDLIVRARFQEAKSLVEAILESRANENQPPIIFYFLKGYLLEGAGDHSSAIGYLRSTQQLWPQWILPYVLEAQAHSKMDNPVAAATGYRNVLKVNPTHAVARIELGLLEYKNFNHFEQGEQHLKQGLDAGLAAPRPVLSRGYFGLAEISLKRGNNSGALKFAQKSFSLNSSNTSAKNLIVQLGGVEKLKNTKVKGQQLLFEGDQFAREGDCHAAQAHYKAAFEEDMKNAVAALKAAQCLWQLSFSTEALEWLDRAIKADPKLMEAYVTMADYHTKRFNFLAAAKILESARKINPKSHEIYRGFALVELRRGSPSGAITFGKKALELYGNDVETQILMAQASLTLKDYRMAYNYAAKAVDLDVNHRKAQIVYAEALAGLQGVDVGIDYYLRLVNNYPLVSEYRLAFGKMLLADERYQQAEEVFRQITRLEEKPKEAYVELAKVLKAQGKPQEALDLLLKAAVLDPADAEPLFLAGTIYLDMRKSQEAMVQFQRVLTINKLFPLVHYSMGRASLLLNDPRQALGHTEQEKKVNPNLPDSYLLAAEAHIILQQYTLCTGEIQKAIKLQPQPATTYVKLAMCYRKSGNQDAAIAMLNVAATKEPGLAEVWKEMGAYYESRGDLNRAIESYNQYFALDPEAPDRAAIEQRISALQRGQRP